MHCYFNLFQITPLCFLTASRWRNFEPLKLVPKGLVDAMKYAKNLWDFQPLLCFIFQVHWGYSSPYIHTPFALHFISSAQLPHLNFSSAVGNLSTWMWYQHYGSAFSSFGSVIKNNLTWIQVMTAACTWVLPLVGSQGNGDIILWDFENKTRRGPMLKMPSAVNALVINLAPWRMKGWNRKAQQILENQLKAGNEGKPFKEKSCKQKSNLWKNLEWKVVEML